jgi:hypothetical protein
MAKDKYPRYPAGSVAADQAFVAITDGEKIYKGDSIADFSPGGIPAAALPTDYYNANVALAADNLHDITFTGKVRDTADTADLVLSSALTKQVDVNWVAGNDAGGKASSVTLSAGLTLHMFLIGDGTNVDAGFDTSITATNLLADATGYTTYRRVASMTLDGSSDWTQFIQRGNDFLLNTAGVTNNSDDSPGTGVNTYTLSEVPADIRVKAYIVTQLLRNANNAAGHWFETDLGNMSVTATAPYELRVRAGGDTATTTVAVWTTTSREVSYQQDDANPDLRYGVIGWFDSFESVAVQGGLINQAGSGSWEPIVSPRAITNVAQELITFDETRYSEIKMIISGAIPATDGASMECVVGDSGGVITANYAGLFSNMTAVAWQLQGISDAILLGNSVGSAAGESLDATIYLRNFENSDLGCNIDATVKFINSGGDEQVRTVHGFLDSTNTAIDRIGLQPAAGLLEAAGTIALYGFVK